MSVCVQCVANEHDYVCVTMPTRNTLCWVVQVSNSWYGAHERARARVSLCGTCL